MTNSQFDLEIAARTVWMEARGEGEQGMRAVAAVIFNRTRRNWRGAQSMAEVCLQPLQFSCWNPMDPNRVQMARLLGNDPLLSKCRDYVVDAREGNDPTKGAVLYCAAVIAAKVNWTKEVQELARIGRHVFYTDQSPIQRV